MSGRRQCHRRHDHRECVTIGMQTVQGIGMSGFDSGLLAVGLLVLLALAFDFMNGFHDAANAIAAVVSTGVLKPYQAVIWAAFFNVAAILLFDMNVAATVGKGIVATTAVDNHLIFGALV